MNKFFLGRVNLGRDGLVPIHNPGSDAMNVVVLEEELRSETLDAFSRRGTLIRPGGFMRVLVDKVTRNGEAIFTVRPIE